MALPRMDGVETARMIQGDRVQLCQLFFHLIDNAIKFRSASQPHAHISAREQGGDWVFSVKDNGVGIDPKFHDSLFLISEHIRETESKTGIGLAICKKIVERQGGRIQVESEKGKGSTFRFTIPKGGGQWGEKLIMSIFFCANRNIHRPIRPKGNYDREEGDNRNIVRI
ncbi:MAG: GHKL domain-containing protein [Euryarchaeota archaeon]|nr:GHKL domain-containing protein [Euryarchaeota archaeon]